MSWPVLVFDIESIPDMSGLRLAEDDLAGLSDQQVYQRWADERKSKNLSDFLPLYLQRVLVISCVFRNAEGLRIHSFVDREPPAAIVREMPGEARVIQSFFNSIDKHAPARSGLRAFSGSGSRADRYSSHRSRSSAEWRRPHP